MRRIYTALSYPIAILAALICGSITSIPFSSARYAEFTLFFCVYFGVITATWAICIVPITIILQSILRRLKLLGDLSTLFVFAIFGALFPLVSMAFCGSDWVSLPASKEMRIVNIAAVGVSLLLGIIITILLPCFRRTPANGVIRPL